MAMTKDYPIVKVTLLIQTIHQGNGDNGRAQTPGEVLEEVVRAVEGACFSVLIEASAEEQEAA